MHLVFKMLVIVDIKRKDFNLKTDTLTFVLNQGLSLIYSSKGVQAKFHRAAYLSRVCKLFETSKVTF